MWRSRKVQGRAVVVEALVHVRAVLQVVLEQVDLAVARRRVKGHSASRRAATRARRTGRPPSAPRFACPLLPQKLHLNSS